MNASLILLCLLNVWIYKELKLRKVRNSENNVVTKPYIIKSLIHLRYPGQNTFKCCHKHPSLFLTGPLIAS